MTKRDKHAQRLRRRRRQNDAVLTAGLELRRLSTLVKEKGRLIENLYKRLGAADRQVAHYESIRPRWVVRALGWKRWPWVKKGGG